jgi:tRNA pseudouridine38-40 synthase
MGRIKLTLEYEGTNYVGWQSQANGPSVQARVQEALQELTGVAVPIVAAGRTDSGVHASGQVIAFDAPRPLPLRAFWLGLNGVLPPDIAVVRAEEVPDAFDPRRWALSKRYRYRLSNRRSRSPLRRFTHWEVYAPVDVAAMRVAAGHVLGEHDFSAFRASDCQARHARRRLLSVDVGGESGGEVSFVFSGTAFLKHMVRNLVGSLVQVGRGHRAPEWMRRVLEGKDRTRAGPTAPPQGLVLEEVSYGPGPRADDGGEDDG